LSPETKPRLTVGIIGVGSNVFNMHRPGLQDDLFQIVGVNDIRTDVGEKIGAEWGCPHYPDLTTLLAEAKPDVVVILPPHPFHAAMSIEALNAGAHVLVEKPIAVHVGEAEEMIAAAQRNNRLLAVNFQQRLRPEIVAAKRLIDEGRLGKIQHVDIKITWTRPAIYYSQVAWRGTWNGEGGAVLMNQGPHELDLLCHLVGMPARVVAWTRTIAHKIETEDTVQAMLEWADGSLGSVHISTAEAGQPQRFEIIGTGGYLAISSGSIKFQRFERDLLDFIITSDNPFSAPEMIEEQVEIASDGGDHAAIYRNLYAAITEGVPLAADGITAMRGLELSNAMTYSSRRGIPVEFPLDRAKYLALLNELRGQHR